MFRPDFFKLNNVFKLIYIYVTSFLFTSIPVEYYIGCFYHNLFYLTPINGHLENTSLLLLLTTLQQMTLDICYLHMSVGGISRHEVAGLKGMCILNIGRHRQKASEGVLST